MGDSIEVIAKESDVQDRISDLPSPIIDHILDFMPLSDATRTSILSRKWRYVSASHPSIILDPNWFKHGRTYSQNDFVNTTTGIFLQHLGPIQKFSLKFPSLDRADTRFYPFVDHLLLFLSRNGVREITLHNPNEKAYSLPSCVFYVPQLSHLALTYGIFKLPNNFHSFRELAYLKLVRTSFFISNATTVLSTPLLECLILSSCSGVRHFKISAPKLSTLHIYNNDDVDLSGFLISKHLQTAFIALADDKSLLSRIEFTKIFDSWPLISGLSIDGPTLMCLAADSELQRLPTTCSSLKHLVLQHIKFGDMHQIATILCLLRSSPLLSKLEISVDSHVKEAVSNYLSESQGTVGRMDNLQNVTVEHFKGTKAELLFVKLLLSCSPRLKTIAVQESPSPSLNEKYSILKQLMRLPRASKEAVIVFEPDVKIPLYHDGLFTGLL